MLSVVLLFLGFGLVGGIIGMVVYLRRRGVRRRSSSMNQSLNEAELWTRWHR